MYVNAIRDARVFYLRNYVISRCCLYIYAFILGQNIRLLRSADKLILLAQVIYIYIYIYISVVNRLYVVYTYKKYPPFMTEYHVEDEERESL